MKNDPEDLTGHVALITGGRSGIGRSIARALQHAGSTVLVASRRSAPAGSADQEPTPVMEFSVDVGEEASVATLFREIQKTYKTIDFLIHAAGTGSFGPIMNITPRDWEQTLRTNLTGPFLVTRAALPLMQTRGGRVIFLGSVAGNTALPENGAYGPSKFGLRGFSLMLSQELAAAGIRATHLCIGAVRSDIWNERDDPSRFAPERMLSPERVAQVVVDLCRLPLDTRVDEISILPPDGIL